MVSIITLFAAISAYGQPLTSDELRKLHEKNPNAVRVYQDRVLELEDIILKANEKIEWYKFELKAMTGDPNGAKSQIYRRIEQEEEKIKEARKNLQSAYRHYRSLIPENE